MLYYTFTKIELYMPEGLTDESKVFNVDERAFSIIHETWLLRWQAFEQAISSERISPWFRYFCLSQCFDTGRTNSTVLSLSDRSISLFSDPYRREVGLSSIDDVGMNLSALVSRERLADNKVNILYEPAMENIVSAYVASYNNFIMTQQLAGDLFTFRLPIQIGPDILHEGQVIALSLSTTDKYGVRLLKILGNLGALLNTDKLTSLACMTFGTEKSLRQNNLFKILKYKSDIDIEPDDIELPLFNMSSEDTLVLINRELDSKLSTLNQGFEEAGFYFYYKVLKQFINDIEEEKLNEEEGQAQQITLALNRFLHLLTDASCLIDTINTAPINQSEGSDELIKMQLSMQRQAMYFDWLNRVSLMLDELTFTFCANQTSHQTLLEIQNKLSGYIETTSGVSPAFSTLCSSGMQAISRGISLSIEALFQEADSLTIYASKKNYFEIIPALKTILGGRPKNIDSSDSVYFRHYKKGTSREGDKFNGIVQLIVSSFYSNVLGDESDQQFTDIFQLIEKQFKLREAFSDNSRLYVSLDRTMESFDEVTLNLLNSAFESYINSGKLIVFGEFSCNKLFSFGLDKAHAGLLYAVAQLDENPALLTVIQKIPDNDLLGGLPIHSVTTQLIMKLIDHPDLLNEYVSMIRGKSRYVYQALLQPKLGAATSFISMDNPEVFLFNAKGSSEASEQWPFMVFRCNHFNNHYQLRENIFQLFIQIVNKLGIHLRDGFGFAETTAVLIAPLDCRCLRISIGTEANDDMQLRFSSIANLILIINQVLTDNLTVNKEEGIEIEEKTYHEIISKVNLYLRAQVGKDYLKADWMNFTPSQRTKGVSLAPFLKSSIAVSKHGLFSKAESAGYEKSEFMPKNERKR